MFFLIFLNLYFSTTLALNNGLGIEPIFGWTTGDRYSCNVDCINYPNDCLSERLIRSVADVLSLSSFSRFGYKFIVVGDCWMDASRDSKGRLQADGRRFPSGMPKLISYLHSKNLKVGLHVDLGNQTCFGFPGSKNNYDLDAQTLAAWGVDLVTVNACGLDYYADINRAYVDFGKSLNKTNYPIVYFCDWPVILEKKGGGRADFKKVAETCNFFKIHSYSVKTTELLTQTILDYNKFSYQYQNYTGPGSYINLDQLTIGGPILSHEQEKAQLTFWSLVNSPMLMSCDITNIRPVSKQILLNKRFLDITKKQMGTVAEQKFENRMVLIWTKSITPTGSFAVALFNTNIVGLPSHTSFQLNSIGLSTSPRYNVTEIFTGDYYGVFKPWHYFNAEVEPCSVLFFEFTAI